MSSPELLTLFDRFADAPGGVEELRKAILDLAVRGKLVGQDEGDMPTNEVRIQMLAARRELASRMAVKKVKEFPPVENVPYQIPGHWIWLNLGEMGITQTGTTPSKNHAEYFGSYIPFIKPNDLNLRHVNYSNEGLSTDGLKASGRLAPSGTLLMVCIGTVGKCQMIDRDCSFNQQINSLTPVPLVDPAFLYHAVSSEYFQITALGASSCTTIAILNKGRWEQLPFPLPPLAEQKRIVAKVEELMGLCDELEAAQAERERQRNRLNASSLHRIATAPDDKALRTAARFHFQILPRVTVRPDQIAPLRQTILDLAISGKLAPQIATDGSSACEMIQQMARAKANLVAKKKIRASKPLPDILDEEKPFGLAKTFDWVRLDALVEILGDGIHGTPEYDESGEYFFINGNNLNDGSIKMKLTTKRVSAQEYQRHRKPLSDRTVLVSINGTLGNVAFYEGEKVMLGKSACYFNLFPQVERKFVKLVIKSSYFLTYAFQEATGATIKNLSLKAMRYFPVPLPPLAEQHRIVAKVDELMALCDELEASLTCTQTESRRLLDSVMAELSA